MDLKQILADLSDRLTHEYNFKPPSLHFEEDSVTPIVVFGLFLDNNPAARKVLSELGLHWPME